MSDDGRPRLARQQRVGGDGVPEVFCADEQNDLRRRPRSVGSSWRSTCCSAEGVRGLAELAVLFVSEREMAELNDSYMGKPGPTDVLAFPIDAAEAEIVQHGQPPSRGPDRAPPDPADMPLLLGDVVICPAVAARQAPEHAGTLDDELALLVVHGVLHVLGHDHADEAERLAMQARERELLEQHVLAWPGAGRLPSGAPSPVIAFNNVDLLMLVDDLRPAARADLHVRRRDGPVADHQAEGGVARRSGAQVGQGAEEALVSAPERWVNPLLLTVNICQTVQATLTGILSDRLWGTYGVIVGVALNVLVFFVLAEAVPKTYAVLYPQKAALATARPVSALVAFPPLRLVSRWLIWLTNVIVRGKGLEQGPFVTESGAARHRRDRGATTGWSSTKSAS